MKRRADATLEAKVMLLETENAHLRSIHARDMEALKESTQLLLKSKPPRPHISSEKKLLIAGEQKFRCAGDKSRCPMWLLNGGNFDEAGFEIDHYPPWREAFRSDRSVLQALCHSCHALKTRMERIRDQELRGDAAGMEEG